MAIENYGELKTAVQSYLNRNTPELLSRIETFIALGERKLFRQLRCPANERITDFDNTTVLTIPGDYLECKFFLADGKPLERVTDFEYTRLQDDRSAVGEPKYFARIGNQFFIHPVPDEPVLVTLYYWADLSGDLITDESTNEILRIMPDVYLYSALIEAQPWLKDDQRMGTWLEMFKGSIQLVNDQRDRAEVSGSMMTVGAQYGD